MNSNEKLRSPGGGGNPPTYLKRPVIYVDIATVHRPRFFERVAERAAKLPTLSVVLGIRRNVTNTRHPAGLLCTSGERPHGRSAGKDGDELAPMHPRSLPRCWSEPIASPAALEPALRGGRRQRGRSHGHPPRFAHCGGAPAGSATAAARVAWRSTLVLQRSEIRLLSSRDCGVFFGAVFMWVFSTDILGPLAEYAPIGFGRGPSGCEDAFVLDRELEL
jgi:hypothetical protein